MISLNGNHAHKKSHLKTVILLLVLVLIIIGVKTAAAANASTCVPVPDAVPKIIDMSFTEGQHVENVAAVQSPNEFFYIGGDIVGADGVREHSSAVWLLDDSEAIYLVYSLSSSARKTTTLPDGRDLASAGDEFGSAVIDCVSGR